jgi:dimethylhistidine N-methyltransferase
MRKRQKELPTKYLYDSIGSNLFEQICKLEEYYPTRVETGILLNHIDEIVKHIKPKPIIIEPGSGSSTKTRILLDHIPEISAYLPVDISGELLQQSAEALRAAYPNLNVLPITTDFTESFTLPRSADFKTNKLVFFPGSTIGNFYPNQVTAFLRRIGRLVGSGGGLLIGVDLVKDRQVLHNAYNDARGVTAAFNLNLLNNVNTAVGSDFNPEQFRHLAFFNSQESRIEMHLISTIDQKVQIGSRAFLIKKNESILTEVSYKYKLESFVSLAEKAGFEIRNVWLDQQKYFSVQYLERR